MTKPHFSGFTKRADGMDVSRAFVVLEAITADHLRQKFPPQNFQTELEWIRAGGSQLSPTASGRRSFQT